MTPNRPTSGRILAEHHDLAVMLLLVLGVIVTMLVATAVLGWNVSFPTYELSADPAGALPF